MSRESLSLAAILVTHHHDDHTGGIAELQTAWHAEVYGPAAHPVSGLTRPLQGGEYLPLLGIQFEVLAVPGHTPSHLAYYCAARTGIEPLLFCGDTLFSAGCGRLFGGTPAQMHASLQRLMQLPENTRLCCAHEYTLANLRFAQAVEPGNADITACQTECQQLRTAGQPTLPARLGRERHINPFVRCDVPAVIDAALQHGATGPDPVSVFTALRNWKNDFR